MKDAQRGYILDIPSRLESPLVRAMEHSRPSSGPFDRVRDQAPTVNSDLRWNEVKWSWNC